MKIQFMPNNKNLILEVVLNEKEKEALKKMFNNSATESLIFKLQLPQELTIKFSTDEIIKLYTHIRNIPICQLENVFGRRSNSIRSEMSEITTTENNKPMNIISSIHFLNSDLMLFEILDITDEEDTEVLASIEILLTKSQFQTALITALVEYEPEVFITWIQNQINNPSLKENLQSFENKYNANIKFKIVD